MNFEFETDAESNEYCRAIAYQMCRLFGIPFEEAVGRMNDRWRGQVIIGHDILYHEPEDYWANNIYYGGAIWWISTEKPQPVPYPRD